MADELEIFTIPHLPLATIAEDGRWAKLDQLEAYYRGKQDASKRFDWDGRTLGYGAMAPGQPGWVVPYSMRRPRVRYDLGKVIVRRLTSMAIGAGRFPTITVAGDEKAEDYVRELAKVSKLAVRMIEARNLGGACGTVCMSWGLQKGRPAIQIHNAKHCTVLAWDDDDELRPLVVIKAYSYLRSVIDEKEQKVVQKKFWAVRFWDQNLEARWRDIPDRIAREPDWATQVAPMKVIRHGFGFTPFYWIQNVADSSSFDGESDIEGLEDNMDALNRLASATVKGTQANVDPTLVVHMEPAVAQGQQVFKGSENAIFSPQGASYLELKGTAVTASKEQARELKGQIMDTAGVIDADPEKLSGAAQSAQALRILYAPQADRCDLIREQYGDSICMILRDMLEVSRAAPLIEVEGGEEVQRGMSLPPRFEREGEGDDAIQVAVEREPGESSEVDLQWPPYFTPTWQDMKNGAEATKTATGGKPVLSQRSAVATVARLFDVQDPDAEVEQIEHEGEKALERMQDAMGPPGPMGGSIFDDPDKPKPPKPPKPGTAKKQDEE